MLMDKAMVDGCDCSCHDSAGGFRPYNEPKGEKFQGVYCASDTVQDQACCGDGMSSADSDESAAVKGLVDTMGGASVRA